MTAQQIQTHLLAIQNELQAKDDEPSEYSLIASEWKAAQSALYEERKRTPPHYIARCSSLGTILTGGYGITAERQTLLDAFDAYEKTGVAAELLLDKGFISKSGKGKLTKYQDEYTKLKTERDNPQLSQTVISELKDWYWYNQTGCAHPQIATKEIRKGNECEQDGIDLYNARFGTEYAKNTVRLTNKLLTGECDMRDPPKRLIVDIKCCYDYGTWHSAINKAHNERHKYVAQGDGYMELYDADHYQIAYCLVDTPEHLLYEKYDRHGNPYGVYSHLPVAERIHIVSFDRCEKRINAIKERVAICQQKVVEMWHEKQELVTKNDF